MEGLLVQLRGRDKSRPVVKEIKVRANIPMAIETFVIKSVKYHFCILSSQFKKAKTLKA